MSSKTVFISNTSNNKNFFNVYFTNSFTKFLALDGSMKMQTSQNSFNTHEKSRSYDVSHHQPEHVIPFSKTDFENLPGSLEV